MESSNLTLCVVNAFLSSIASILNILTIYAIRKTPSLAKNLKILLLSLAVSGLGISLLAQPMYVEQLTMQWKYRNESYNAIYIADLIPTNIFITATLFSVMALCAERFLAIQLHLRYQELVIYKRVIIAVISIWVFSTLTLLLKMWISKNIMFVFSVIKDASSIITATFLSIKLYPTLRRHINQIQLTQVAQNEQGKSVQRKMRSAMASLYVYLIFTVCYLPNICVLIIIGSTSERRNDLQHLHFYTLTLLFLNSTLNPLIYCWKVKQIRHTVIATLRNILSSHI